MGDICGTNDYYYSLKEICNKTNYSLNREIVVTPEYQQLLIRYASDNLVVLKVFFKEPYYTSIVKKDKFSIINFVANVGGLMGLCIGLSLVSVAEWIYHFAKLFYNMCRD